MKNTIFLLLLVLITSCSNDTTEVTPAPVVESFTNENPLPGYLSKTGYNQQSIPFENTNNYEVGFIFKPLKKGKIKSLVVKLPNTNHHVTVNIWDLYAHAIIRTETIDVTNGNTEITKTIVPLDLIKNKEYAITMLSNQYYKKNRIDLGTTNHPITIGNIKISGSYLSNGDTQNPSFVTLIGRYNGECSFNFLRTE